MTILSEVLSGIQTLKEIGKHRRNLSITPYKER